MNNKLEFLSKLDTNDRPGHTLDDKLGMPIRRSNIKRDRDMEHEERMAFGNALHLEVEERKNKL